MSKPPREIARSLVDQFEVLSLRALRIDAIEAALRSRDDRAALIATKKAEALRKAAHVVQQPTEEALRMAELAISTADDIAAAIRKENQ